jgi:hypothetical protein
MTSESTRFLGQPREMNPTEGAAGGEILVTVLLYVGHGLRTSEESEVSERSEVSEESELSSCNSAS